MAVFNIGGDSDGVDYRYRTNSEMTTGDQLVSSVFGEPSAVISLNGD